jgi:hypothetical protein
MADFHGCGIRDSRSQVGIGHVYRVVHFIRLKEPVLATCHGKNGKDGGEYQAGLDLVFFHFAGFDVV